MDEMKPSLGQPARREKFFPRDEERKKILEALDLGENLLISAPRRVGKTSILMRFIDEPNPSIYFVYSCRT